jgi:5-methyltetrahydropteroyltriglutamate--homocysteine methyltransferase
MHIPTTHTGSLPRPDSVLRLLYKRMEQGTNEEVESDLATAVADAVHAAVARQVELGIDVVNDGELGKISYATYVADRMTGFDIVESERGQRRDQLDIEAFPEFAARRREESGRGYYAAHFPVCTGPVEYTGLASLETELATLRSAVDAAGATDAFVTAASPGVIPMFIRNRYYPDRDSYLEALGEAMRVEYDAIHAAGFTLQLDCPDLAFGVMAFVDDEAKVHRHVAHRVEVLNAATARIPAEAMRIHVCWGNYDGPHHLDVPLGRILDDVLAARPATLVLEAANPRHEHEWKIWGSARLPKDAILIPGVISHSTVLVEHPELVAERIGRYASLVGRERVIAGSDCGFATFAGSKEVHPSIVWAKLQALADGAKLASRELWKKAGKAKRANKPKVVARRKKPARSKK